MEIIFVEFLEIYMSHTSHYRIAYDYGVHGCVAVSCGIAYLSIFSIFHPKHQK